MSFWYFLMISKVSIASREELGGRREGLGPGDGMEGMKRGEGQGEGGHGTDEENKVRCT